MMIWKRKKFNNKKLFEFDGKKICFRLDKKLKLLETFLFFVRFIFIFLFYLLACFVCKLIYLKEIEQNKNKIVEQHRIGSEKNFS